MSLCRGAIERGVFAQAIRPPTVPEGTSRLRLAAMASHTPVELKRAATVLADVARMIGLDPASLGEPAPSHPAIEPAEAPAGHESWGWEPEQYGEPERGEEKLQITASRRTGPFDHEQSAGELEAPATAEGPAKAPFDLEHEDAHARAA